MARVGILALQGAFARHAEVVERLGHRAVLVRSSGDLEARDGRDMDGFIFPGGESSVQMLLLEELKLVEPLAALIRAGRPVLATCAGLILVAGTVTQPAQRSLGFVDVSVARNAWGRQIDSFETRSDRGDPLVFIRAPRILRVGAGVDVLARFSGEPVLVRQGNITGATFHPELTDSPLIHEEVFGGRHSPRCHETMEQTR